MHPHGFGTEGPTKPQWPSLLARTRAYPLFRFNFAVTGSRAREAAGGEQGVGLRHQACLPRTSNKHDRSCWDRLGDLARARVCVKAAGQGLCVECRIRASGPLFARQPKDPLTACTAWRIAQKIIVQDQMTAGGTEMGGTLYEESNTTAPNSVSRRLLAILKDLALWG